jgi:hypothetical protein
MLDREKELIEVRSRRYLSELLLQLFADALEHVELGLNGGDVRVAAGTGDLRRFLSTQFGNLSEPMRNKYRTNR